MNGTMMKSGWKAMPALLAVPAPLVLMALLAPIVQIPPAAAQVEDYRDIEFPELQDFEIPRPETFALDNGLEVFLLEDRELPLIEVVARIRTGSVYEPADKTGLAGLLGAVQRTGGTRTMTGDEIDDFLEARAASVETNVGNTVGFASMDCLAGDFDEVLTVFHDILRFPGASPVADRSPQRQRWSDCRAGVFAADLRSPIPDVATHRVRDRGRRESRRPCRVARSLLPPQQYLSGSRGRFR